MAADFAMTRDASMLIRSSVQLAQCNLTLQHMTEIDADIRARNLK